ncbi:MAG TPA: AMP-binding protein [Casimicrobiaceae bacterium]|nr:AMP-binding protein [Casimicrobiaceae bacterium]
MPQLLTLAEVVAAQARQQPAKIGARDSKRAVTFAQWHERASRLANALVGLGLAKGDRVAVLAYNRLEWMEIYVALASAGLIAVPINFRLIADEVAYIAQHCDARAFIVQDVLADRVADIVDQLDIPVARYVLIGDGEAPGDWQRYESLLERAAPSPLSTPIDDRDTWALMYTSGTTGRPKGAVRSHRGSALISLVTALDVGFTRDDAALLVMPMCHANSLYFSFTLTYCGGTCVIDDSASFDPERVLAALGRGVTFTSLVPTHYIMMLALPDATKKRHDVRAIDKLMCSSAPVRRDTKLGILEQFPNSRLFELYGSTEAGWVTLLRPDEQLTKLGSVGREWTGSGAIKLLDGDGVEVNEGEAGELFSNTPYAFDGYWKNPEKTAEAFRGAWCSVGDIARRDSEGYYYLVDRKSNMIISGGENVYPSEVEQLLGQHPAVKDVAVVGLPHEKWGEAVHAALVLHDGADLDEPSMLAWCRDRIAGYKRPRSVSFHADAWMPRTATGKVQHRVLRERLQRSG